MAHTLPAQCAGCVRLRGVSESHTGPLPTHTDSVRIAAPPARVWELVTAMERYGEWSSENTGGYWRKGPDGVPGTGKVGDQFVGVNRRDGVEWKALVEIVAHKDDIFNLIRWKEIYEMLEETTDTMEDVADVLQRVVIKNG